MRLPKLPKFSTLLWEAANEHLRTAPHKCDGSTFMCIAFENAVWAHTANILYGYKQYTPSQEDAVSDWELEMNDLFNATMENIGVDCVSSDEFNGKKACGLKGFKARQGTRYAILMWLYDEAVKQGL